MRNSIVLGLILAFAACNNDQDFRERNGTDTWFQAENNKVDILFVVDNSCSMAEEQATLAEGFVSFADKLDASGTDFQIGVITTSFEYDDPERGKLIGSPAFLTAEDDYVTLFDQRTRVGVTGSDKEKGLEAAAYALSPILTSGPNSGFVRADARLLTVFVSDEEDCSDDGALAGQSADACYLRKELLTPVGELVTQLVAIKDEPRDVQAGAIIGVTDAGCLDVYPGARYAEAARLMGGLVQDICEGDWSGMLTELGLNATGVRSTFQLSNAAVADSIEVYVNDELVEKSTLNGWSYDEASRYLRFGREAVPPRGATIVANYTILAGARTAK